MLPNANVELEKEIKYSFLTNKTKEKQHKQLNYGLILGAWAGG